jgi:hypothetical protein
MLDYFVYPLPVPIECSDAADESGDLRIGSRLEREVGVLHGYSTENQALGFTDERWRWSLPGHVISGYRNGRRVRLEHE